MHACGSTCTHLHTHTRACTNDVLRKIKAPQRSSKPIIPYSQVGIPRLNMTPFVCEKRKRERKKQDVSDISGKPQSFLYQKGGGPIVKESVWGLGGGES